MPPTYQQIAVDRLYANAHSLEGNFQATYQNEKNRVRMKDSYEAYAPNILKDMNSLVKGNLAAALAGPKSAFNQFISAWNEGTGDLTRSYNQLAEFWRLLSNARPAIDALTTPAAAPPAPPQPPAPAKPTAADLDQFRKLATAANDLLDPFEACVKAHQPAEASQIAELVRQINELLKIDPSQAAANELNGPKSAWASFTRRYNAGRDISQASFAMLKQFEAMMQAADKNIR